MNANGGGAFIDGKFHFISYVNMEGIGYFAQYFIYDTKTWNMTLSQEVNDLGFIAITSAYDQTSQCLYGTFFTSDMKGYEFGYLDYATMTKTKIKSVDTYYMAMAVNSKGDLYAINSNGTLLKVDKATGAETVIGSTGLSPFYQQSMTFDNKTDKLYWAASFMTKPSGLYEVDVTNGAVKKIADFPNNEEILCLYATGTEASEGAPGKVTDLKENFEKDATTGTITFTAPSTSYSGAQLTSDITYKVNVNGTEKSTGTATPGQAVSINLTLPEGQNKVEVIASNNAGASPAASIEFWVGLDLPTNVVCDINEETGVVKITWDAPQGGQHNGYISENLVYYVRRYPEYVLKGTDLTVKEFADTIQLDKLASYYYEIYAKNSISDTKKGESYYTDAVVLGKPIEPNYTEPFTDKKKFSVFTVIDVNKDGKTWEWNRDKRVARAMGSDDVKSDDWLITPPLHLKPGLFYKFKFKARRGLDNYEEFLSVRFGNGKTPDKLTEEILPKTELVSGSQFQEFEKEVSVETEGTYYFGFHAESPAGMFAIYLDDVSVSKGVTFDAPDSVTNFKVVAGAEADLKATVSFNAPTQSINKQPLTTLTKIDIFRGRTLVNTISNPQPGNEYTFVDNDVVNGLVTYTVAATNDTGTGIRTSCSAYIGHDTPKAPKNIVLKDNFDGTLGLSWEKPGAVGKNGGYVDESDLSYNIYDINLETSETTLRKGNIEDMSYVINDVNLEGRQDILLYLATAKSENGESEMGYSNVIIKGTPYTLPYSESLAGGKLKKDDFWWVETSSAETPDFAATNEMSSDNDYGCAVWKAGTLGEWASFNSGKIALKDATNPVLMFSYYAVPGKDIQLTVEAFPAGQDSEEIKEIDFRTLSGAAGWQRVSVELNDVKNAPYTILKFRVKSNETTVTTGLDDFLIMDVLKDNLAATINGPTVGEVGQPVNVEVNVKSLGQEVASGFTVDLYAGSRLVESKDGGSLNLLEDKTYSFVYTPKVEDAGVIKLHAIANYSKDLDMSDNTTSDVSMVIKMPELPTVTDLSATPKENRTVSLNWNEPSSLVRTIVDDMEGHTLWAIDNIGNWKTVDRDQLPTAGIQGFWWDNMGYPQAFIVFDPYTIGLGKTERYKAHSGNQYLASFAAAAEEGESVNDDWLISPELNGDAQTISLWAKGASLTYTPETFEILYSTTTSEPEEFKLISTHNPAGDVWTEYTAQLPEGTKFFAIHCVSEDKLALLLDDITYHTGKLTVKTYNIYRDGNKVASVGADVHEFIDQDVSDGQHVYNVTVVYPEGESVFSNDASTLITNLNGLQENVLSVRTSKGMIIINNAGGENISVYNTNGTQVFNANNEADVTIPVQRGQYIVKVGAKVFNLTVR